MPPRPSSERMTYLPRRPPTCTCSRELAVAALRGLVPVSGLVPDVGIAPVTGSDPVTGMAPVGGLDLGLMGGGWGGCGFTRPPPNRRQRRARERVPARRRDPWGEGNGRRTCGPDPHRFPDPLRGGTCASI